MAVFINYKQQEQWYQRHFCHEHVLPLLVLLLQQLQLHVAEVRWRLGAKKKWPVSRKTAKRKGYFKMTGSGFHPSNWCHCAVWGMSTCCRMLFVYIQQCCTCPHTFTIVINQLRRHRLVVHVHTYTQRHQATLALHSPVPPPIPQPHIQYTRGRTHAQTHKRTLAYTQSDLAWVVSKNS